MRTNRLTNALLAIIAVLLALVAARPVPWGQSVMAQAPPGGLIFSSSGYAFWLLDTRTGDVWFYDYSGSNYSFKKTVDIRHLGRLTDPGKPLQK